jgi:hypothetical protein
VVHQPQVPANQAAVTCVCSTRCRPRINQHEHAYAGPPANSSVGMASWFSDRLTNPRSNAMLSLCRHRASFSQVPQGLPVLLAPISVPSFGFRGHLT